MSLATGLAGQLADPHGLTGQWLGAAMDLANSRAVRSAVDLLDPQAGERVLDGGCGTGAALAEVLRRARCELTGVDRSATMIAATRRRLGLAPQLHCSTLQDAPLEAQGFDAALLLNVLYFCDAEAAMVASVHRALRPGGRLVAYVTHRETMARWRFTRSGLHRLYDEAELAAVLQQGGFAADAIRIHEQPVARGVRGLFAIATA